MAGKEIQNNIEKPRLFTRLDGSRWFSKEKQNALLVQTNQRNVHSICV